MNRNRVFSIATVILIFLLATSVVLNLVLYRYANQYYLQLNSTRLDPLGLVFYRPSDPPPSETDIQKAKAVFFGDSRAYQWREPQALDQFIFINRGIEAQTSTQVVERFDEHILPLQPDILVVQVGINDLKTIPLFPYLKQEIIGTCKANLEQIVHKAKNQDIKVVLTTIFPLGELPIERRLFWSADVGLAIDEVNEYIHSLEDEDVVIFDTASVLANDRGRVRTEYSFDFLHLNEQGYLVLNEKLGKLLVRFGAENAASKTK